MMMSPGDLGHGQAHAAGGVLLQFVFIGGKIAMVANRRDACRRPPCRMDECLQVPYTFADQA
ncbi:hypothetical protein AC233_00720 [Burkholderia sp. HB1]|nr:hypothetical protein AC233_00720 [Burkholderia sp. HB1]